MKKILVPALALLTLGLAAACSTTPAESTSASTTPAKTEAAAPVATAAPAAAGSLTIADIKTPANPYIFDSFERTTAEGKILLGGHQTATWANLSDSGWGGWKSRDLGLSSSTEHATEGSRSLLLTIDGKLSTRGGNGACIGLNWDNDGAAAKDFSKNIKEIAYFIIDYTWEPDTKESTMAPPYKMGIFFAAVGSDDSFEKKINGETPWFTITEAGSGTVVLPMSKSFDKSATRWPQWFVKVFADLDEKKNITAELSGKKIVGKLWLDNLRFADASGTVFSR